MRLVRTNELGSYKGRHHRIVQERTQIALITQALRARRRNQSFTRREQPAANELELRDLRLSRQHDDVGASRRQSRMSPRIR